jgi:penicillin-binding protein 1C
VRRVSPLFPSERGQRLGRVLYGIALAPLVALLIAAALTPLPPTLGAPPERGAVSVRVLDGSGRLVREVRGNDGTLATHASLAELGPRVPLAVLAAEDSRFYRHPGIDPVAIARAGAQALWQRRIVSGASTITQQLARSLFDRPRTLSGKLGEMVLALRIEASLSKRRILEEYLNRVEFGANVRGVEAASRLYFDKPAQKLDLAEAATLAAIPRGPTLYDPRRGTERVERRRDRILERMVEQGFLSRAEAQRAKSERVRLQPSAAEGGARHFVRAVLSGALAPELRGQAVAEVTTSVDSDLQREVLALTRSTVERIKSYDASAAAVIVLDNASGDVLAYVGSPDFFDARALGQNDGVLALRQPGSTLKPFVYAAAMEKLGMTPATLLPDVELHLPTAQGDYSPRNYDGRFHGPVRLREALANSLNVPAVFTAEQVGPGAVLEKLRSAGLFTLDRDATHYGAAIALGDGEVRLIDLANAYATLARGGVIRKVRAVKRARLAGGQELSFPVSEQTRVIEAHVAALLGDILSDDGARTSAFGRGSALSLPFPAAVKTGTSKGYRDNWTVGFTREVTVAVWVGNFDGHGMTGSSGVTGAAPLFGDVMMAAMRGRNPEPLFTTNDLRDVEVCALSGKLPGPHCTHRIHERFAPDEVPSESCDLHVEVAIDRRNGLRAGPHCPAAELREFEVYPPRLAGWAASAGRPLPPNGVSSLCPGAAADLPHAGASLGVAYPFDGARFAYDPGLPRGAQAVVLAARAPVSVERVRFLVDGQLVASVAAPFTAPYRLTPGNHVLIVEAPDGRKSAPARFSVE